MSTEDAAFEALLEFLKRSRGLDFTGYKRPSLQRRLQRRMDTVGCESFGDYLDYLEVHPDEYELLFEMLLINVTEFFRDAPVWVHLRENVLPDLLAAKDPGEPVRVWSAGCAGGQEAYTTAMVFAQLMGVEAFRERVKIYATDIDEDALNQARLATYNARETESLPPDLRERYFERADQRLAFRQDLRRTVIFGRTNLVADAPISRLDLLICRNTLMYFNAETQGRILRHFHFALNDGGGGWTSACPPSSSRSRCGRCWPGPASARAATSRPSTGAGGRSCARRRCCRSSARPATASTCAARSC